MLVLWGSPVNRSQRVMWALEELGVPYEHRPIGSRGGEIETPAYRALNPRGKVPLLQHGNFTLAESAAIGSYLADAFREGEGTLALAPPPCSHERALYDQWCFYIVSEIDSQGLYIHRKHVGLPGIYGAAPSAVAAARTYFEKHIGVCADELERGRGGGEQLSILRAGAGFGFSFADILLAHCVEWAESIGWLPDRGVLREYLQQMQARPAYQTVARAKAQAMEAFLAADARANAKL